MNGKPSGLFELEPRDNTSSSKGAESSAWRARVAAQDQRAQLRRRLFGEHYNYTRVGLNKEKQYLLQEQKNTEIERNNLILLQKIQKITKRQPMVDSRRLLTEHYSALDQEELAPPANHVITKRSRYENKTVQSLHESSKASFSARKTPKASKKYVFKGLLEVRGSSYEVKTYFEDDKYVIEVDLGESVQRLRVRREDYMEIYNNLLDRKHPKIAGLMRFNGKTFQLAAVKGTEVEMEKAMRLPVIQKEPRRRTEEGSQI